MTPPYKMSKSDNVQTFTSSQAYKKLTKLINLMNESIKGYVLPVDYVASEPVNKIVNILDKLLSYVSECPIDEKSKSRFGNVAYRSWFDKMSQNAEELIDSNFTFKNQDDKDLILSYFKDSFGNCQRIDYGSGHETAFMFFLCCLYHLDILTSSDCISIVLVIFKKYLQVVRTIQKVYRLEPAGSHGAWGLDDFQFLPYLFGASQLIQTASSSESLFKPSDILNQNLCAKHKEEYLFLGCIDFIYQIKSGPFSEHSSVLYSASQSISWNKVYQGLNRMYVNEVLNKYPIIQHFWFGDLMPLSSNDQL